MTNHECLCAVIRKVPGVIALLLVLPGCDSAPPPAPSPTPAVAAPAPSPPAPSPPAPPPVVSDPLVGRYTLTVTHGCDAVPVAARTRTYAASINTGAHSGFVVTLSEATFLEGPICTSTGSGLGCHQFLASRAEDHVRFDLTNADDWHGGYITERVAPLGTWLEVTGSATGRLQKATIEATGSGSVWYCPTNTGYPFPCNPYVACQSATCV